MAKEYRLKVRVKFRFCEQKKADNYKFSFGSNCLRVVPAIVDDFTGMHSVGLYVDKPISFGDSETTELEVEFANYGLLKKGLDKGNKFNLWDGEVIADVEIL